MVDPPAVFYYVSEAITLSRSTLTLLTFNLSNTHFMLIIILYVMHFVYTSRALTQPQSHALEIYLGYK